MIIDTSAIIAILDDEPDGPAYLTHIRAAEERRMTAPTFLETAIVLDARRLGLQPEQLTMFFEAEQIELTAFTPEHAHLAREAYHRYGKGSGHAAQLNYGDCFAYAAAVVDDDSLLFKGDDFGHTDVRDARADVSR